MKQEDEERGGGMCPKCGVEEEVPIPIRIWAEEKGNLFFFCIFILKEEVDMDDEISHSPEKQQGELLTIVGDPEVGEPCMFGKNIYLSVFYCLCYEMDISTYLSEDQVSEERDPDLNWEEDIIFDSVREDHWSDVS